MIFDKLLCNACNVDFPTCEDVIDLGADFGNAAAPHASYAVELENAATADVTVKVTCGDTATGTGTDLATVVVPAGSQIGSVPLGVIPKRYVAASVSESANGSATGKYTCGILWGVTSPVGVGLN